MTLDTVVLEGTWEEVRAHEQELAGKKVRLVVIPEAAATSQQPAFRPASGRSVLRHAGTWEGDDLEERLAEVYATRSKAKF